MTGSLGLVGRARERLLIDELMATALDARRRGAVAAAARAWRHAADVTPDPGVRADRLLRAAADAFPAGSSAAGNDDESRRLLTLVIDAARQGGARRASRRPGRPRRTGPLVRPLGRGLR